MKKSLFFVPILLIAIFLITIISPIITMSEDISTKVFRLHILANSDNDYDQKLKLCVRDEILKQTYDLYSNCNNVNDAILLTKNNIDYLKNVAENVIKNNGYDYNVKAYVKKEYFNTRKYDSFTLPAGYYDCLKIEIGEGKGHNWWCVMYPNVCLSGCIEDFDKELNKDEISFIKNDKYIVKFKIVEIYEKIRFNTKNLS